MAMKTRSMTRMRMKKMMVMSMRAVANQILAYRIDLETLRKIYSHLELEK